ncbi:hypothetical protein shim_25430 [Shimia sp. SK013]|uniref:hypothetical protein n=1 Tax=Shimia sp. SK013 TaxID=1389006 RepID=UPI0006B58B0F|nr:hypothetical protein [Shimia sp. SK013]KPA21078.1 hypothetical protein shim_25430 [Shimia sp. SK013]
MILNLEGITFRHIMPNSFGTANDGGEIASFQNAGADLKDLSGWQVWVIPTGSDGPDLGQNGLAHEFAKDTFLAPCEPLWVVTELSQDEYWRDVAAQAEIGEHSVSAGRQDRNIESPVALVNPGTGEYIVSSMAEASGVFHDLPGFPGSFKIGEIAGALTKNRVDAGYAYQYDVA